MMYLEQHKKAHVEDKIKTRRSFLIFGDLSGKNATFSMQSENVFKCCLYFLFNKTIIIILTT